MSCSFTPEVTPEIVSDWVSTGRGDLDAERLDGAALRAHSTADAARSRAGAYELFDRWLAQLTRHRAA